MLLAAPAHVVGQAGPSTFSANPDQVCLVIRSGDAGTSHSVNMGLEKQRLDDSELGALLNRNKDGALPEMSRNRQGELDALTPSRFRDALAAHNVRLLTYRQLIAIQGLQSMRRPEG